MSVSPYSGLFIYSPKIRWLETPSYDYMLSTSKHIKLFGISNENGKKETVEKSIPLPRLSGDVICCTDVSNELCAFGNNRGCVFLTDIEDPTCRVIDIRPRYSTINECVIRDIKFNRDDPNVIGVTADSLHLDHPGSIVNVYDLGEFGRENEGLPCVYNASFSHRVLSLNWVDSNRYIVSSINQIEIYSKNCSDQVIEKLNLDEPVNNVTVEPNYGHGLACFTNGIVKIYDLRKFRQPIYVIDMEFSERERSSKNFLELSWNKQIKYDLSLLYQGHPLYNITSSALNDFYNDKPLIKNRKCNDKKDSEHPYMIIPVPIHQEDCIISFDWHPTKKHHLISLSAQKKIFIDTVDHRATAQICPTSKIICSSFDSEIFIRESTSPNDGNKSLKKKKNQSQKDISDIMRSRAINGFGYGESDDPITTCILRCLSAMDNDNDVNKVQKRDIMNVWIWLSRMIIRGIENDIVGDKYRSRFPGMIEIAENGMDREGTYSKGPRIKIESKNKNQKSHGGSSSSDEDEIVIKYRFFQHPRRRDILKICGWPLVDDISSQEYISLKYEQDIQELPRAMTIAAFSGNLDLAKELSTRFICEVEIREDHKKYLGVLKELDRILQSGVGKRVNNYDTLSKVKFYNQYLMALLIFVSVRKSRDNEKFKEIFELEKITFLDKIAFASLFLTDKEFFQECEQIKDTMMRRGQLSALIMTGLYNDQEIHQLFHNYIDRTSDVQNAALLLVIGDCTGEEAIYMNKRTFPTKEKELLSKEKSKKIINPDLFLYEILAKRNIERSSIIIRCYMDLLNVWSLYMNRAFIGCLSKSIRSKNYTKEINEQLIAPSNNFVKATLCCNFCREPITRDKNELPEESNAKKLSFLKRKEKKVEPRSMSCKKCRKPLPKCSICRLYFGTPIPDEEKSDDETNSDNWFCWCTNCLHGGHKKHMITWFKSFDMCPVSGCPCRCIMRDKNAYKDFTKYKCPL
uniref:Zinc_ribbon_16 domain-containing protein n=1 Tax=Parastrongyloides trichosuri TaxID=131310 RepID=A0A0N4ZK27_PARTI